MEHVETIADWIKNYVASEKFKDFIAGALLELCRIRTIPGKDLRETAEGEKRAFDLILRLLRESGWPGTTEMRGISDSIRNHPCFTFPYYAGTERAYGGRANLVFHWRSGGKPGLGRGVALNAHIDTVAPYVDCSRDGEVVQGRGACDDKSGCIAMVAVLHLLNEIKTRFNIVPGGDLVLMFVIDEETGGNGSLSLALDRELKKLYDTLVVLECCDQQIFAGNRGGLWYKVEIERDEISDSILLAMDIVQELEKEGASIKKESDHPLFPQRPIHTSHGIFGPFGEHPSYICGYVEFRVGGSGNFNELSAFAQRGLEAYIKDYGDKTTKINPETGRKVVEKHYDLEKDGDSYLLKIWGSTGHMGSILENDNAITKASFIVREIRRGDPNVTLSFPMGLASDFLVLEGGQGFVPSHTLDQIKQRLQEAMKRAHRNFRLYSTKCIPQPVMTFDKLHNNAFGGDPNSPSIKNAMRSAELLGVSVREPILGFGASCDARLFAEIHPELEIITTGPGGLRVAHSDKEQIHVDDLAKSCGMMALFLLIETGSAKSECMSA
jgi:acetylornithine deacetylase/succinyl-diaminopimelate desuccinylase-like protein